MKNTVLPDLKHVRTFLTVVECGSFSAAAQKLSMTQPGVSIHLKKLEYLLGKTLLERYARKVFLTPAGEKYYPIAISLIEKVVDSIQEMNNVDRELRGWLKVAILGPFSGFLVETLPNFRNSHPNLGISLDFLPDQKILAELANGHLDIGFVTEKIDNNAFEFTEVYSDEMVLAGPLNSLVHKVSTIDELKELYFIDHPSREDVTKKWMMHHFNTVKLSGLHFSLYVNSLDTGILLSIKGLGFGIVPHSVISSRRIGDKVRLVSGPKIGKVLQPIYCVVRANQYQSRKVSYFIKYLKTISPNKI